MSHPSSTRGYGVFEKFLANQRRLITDKLIPPSFRSGKILDIGCGIFPFFLANTDFQVKYGIDKMFPHTGIKTDIGLNIVKVKQDIELNAKLSFPDKTFSAVTALAMIEHIEPSLASQLFTEIHRVLKPDGFYIMTTPAPWTNAILKILAQLRLVSPIEINDHKNLYSVSYLTNLLKETGFREEKIRHGFFELGMNIWLTAKK